MKKENKKEETENTEVFKLFGVKEETVKKAQDIKPVLKLGKDMPYNVPLQIEFMESAPKTVETPNSKFDTSANVITVLDLVTKIEYSMFVSSKTLALGVAKLWTAHNHDLKGVKAQIIKTTAVYKDFGENECYNVQEIKA